MRNAFSGFDYEAAARKLSAFTMNVHDHEMVTDTLAKVILTYSGQPSKEEARTSIAKLFNGMASAVEDSFRPLTNEGEIRSIIGFVRANREVHPWDPKNREIAKNFRVMASNTNLLMDKRDESVWEVRKGATGSYIAKQGNEDLSDLVYLAKASHAGVAPKFSQTASVNADPQEFVAFVSTDSEEVEHGFVVQSNAAKEATETAKYRPASMVVVPHGIDEPVAILASQLIDIRHLDREDIATMGMKMTTASTDKAAQIEYYKKAYSYAPEYVNLVIQQINSMATA
jgi:hypothetical protein